MKTKPPTAPPKTGKSKSSETVELLRQIADNTHKTEGYVKQFLNLSFVAIIIMAVVALLAVMQS